MIPAIAEFPLPGDRRLINDETVTVLASCWTHCDEYTYDDVGFTLLVLRPTAPYYRIVEVYRGSPTSIGLHHNIIPAVEAYSDAIGGY